MAALLAFVPAGGWSQFLPRITVTPQIGAAGSGELKLTVSGASLTPDLQLLWNGQPRKTQFIDSRTLKGIITAEDLAQPGLATVALWNAASGAAASDPLQFLIYLPLLARDLTYDSQRNLLYLSISKMDPNGPSLAILQPDSGVVQRYVPLPSDPGILAISQDAHYVYVALEDRVRCVDLFQASSTVDIPLSSLPQWSGYPVSSMLPLPVQGSSVLISTGGSIYGYTQTYVVDGSQPRQGHANEGAECLVGSPDGSTIYGSNADRLFVFNLTSNGLGFTPQAQIAGLLGGGTCPVFSGGYIYDGAGNIVDPSVPTVVGRFAAWGLVRPVPEMNRTYFMGAAASQNPALNIPFSLLVFDNTTRQQVTSVHLPQAGNVSAVRLVHWGADGLALAALQQGSGTNVPVGVYLFRVPPED